MTFPQIFGVVDEWGRINAGRDLAQLEVINKAVAPFVAKENQGAFDAFAARLRAIVQPVSPRSAARAFFGMFRAKAEQNAEHNPAPYRQP